MAMHTAIWFALGCLTVLLIFASQCVYYRQKGGNLDARSPATYWHWLTQRQKDRATELMRVSVWLAWTLAILWLLLGYMIVGLLGSH